MKFSSPLKKVQRNYQDYGLRVTLGKACSGILAVVLENRAYRIYRIRLDRFVPSRSESADFVLKLLAPEDDLLIDQIEAMEEWLCGKVRGKLGNGSMCLVALDGDRVAGFNLVSFGEVDMPLVNMTRWFRENEAWSEQITVNKNYRGKGLAGTLRLTVFGILKERGVTRFYGGTLPLNIANRKLSKKVGFEEIADIRYRRVLGNKSWEYKRLDDDDKAF